MSQDRGHLYFGVDARHLRQLGRELVADRKTALAELVKNAYDADATHAVIDFVDPREGGVLEIRDDGEGMDLNAIRERWMRLSTAYKEHNPISPGFGRIRAGQKGIGRFAAEMLGGRLILTSTKRGSPTRVIVVFNWGRFDEFDLPLDQVANSYRRLPAPCDEHGTCLRIKKLRHSWSQRDLKKVRRSIQLLQPPFPVAEEYGAKTTPSVRTDPGFEVTIRDGVIKNDQDDSLAPTESERFLDAATAVVEAEVDDAGIATWRVHSERLGLDVRAKYPRPLLITGAFQLRASYFVYRSDTIGNLSVKLAREMGSEYGGVRVYRDGLRVPKYGEKGNDWLRLDRLYRKRGEVLFPIGNNNWFGYVSLSRLRNNLLIDTASREGVIENEAFDELRVFVHDALVHCGRQVNRVRGKKESAARRKLQQPKSRLVLVEKAVALAREAVELASKDRTKEARAVLDRASAVVAQAKTSDATARKTELALLDEISLLRILASLGTSIVVFSHEVRSAINTAIARLVDLQEDADDAPEPWQGQVKQAVGEATSGVERLDSLAEFIEGYASRSRRREREPQPLHASLEAFKLAFRPLIERRSATIDVAVDPPNLRTCPMARSELDAILINLLTNALKAFADSGRSSRKIWVTAEGEDDEVVLKFQDTGRGIPKRIRDSLFEPFVTSSLASDSELGLGTGIGLKIVEDIVEANKGSVGVVEADDGFATCFEVRFPRLVARKEAAHG